MEKIFELIAGVTNITPILALRSLFTFEDEYTCNEHMRVLKDPHNAAQRLLYGADSEEPLLTACTNGNAIEFEANRSIANYPDLCKLKGAWGLMAVPRGEGIALLPNSGKSTSVDDEALWVRVLEIDALWCRIRMFRDIGMPDALIGEAIRKINKRATRWEAVRLCNFNSPSEDYDQEALDILASMKEVASWGLPDLMAVQPVTDVRGGAFELKFKDGRICYWEGLALNWTAQQELDVARFKLAPKVTYGKYDVRPSKIPTDVLAVLAHVDVSAMEVKITQRLTPKLYTKVNDVLVALGGKWHTGRQAHCFSECPKQLLDSIVQTGTVYTDSDYEFFWTSDGLGDRVIEEAEIEKGMLVIEPSAGDGALASKAAAIVGTKLVKCFELMPRNVKHLQAKGFQVEAPTDFLKSEPMEIADIVVMNPPFSGGRDMAHIQHAYKWLKMGGRLVAIASTQWQTSTHGPASAFKAFLKANGAKVYPIEAGAFKEAGTDVPTTLIVLKKPVKAAVPPRAPSPPAPAASLPQEKALQADLFA